MNNSQLADYELLQKISEGDSSALEELYQRYIVILYILTKKLLNNDELVEKTISEIFYIIWYKTRKFEFNKKNVFTWIITLARNKSLDNYRRNAGLENKPYDENYEDYFIIPFMPYSSEDYDLAKVIRHKPKLEEGIEQLTEAQKIVLFLAFEGMNYEEIAAKLKLPLITIKNKIFTSFQILCKYYCNTDVEFNNVNEDYPLFVFNSIDNKKYRRLIKEVRNANVILKNELSLLQNIAASLTSFFLENQRPPKELKNRVIKKMKDIHLANKPKSESPITRETPLTEEIHPEQVPAHEEPHRPLFEPIKNLSEEEETLSTIDKIKMGPPSKQKEVEDRDFKLYEGPYKVEEPYSIQEPHPLSEPSPAENASEYIEPESAKSDFEEDEDKPKRNWLKYALWTLLLIAAAAGVTYVIYNMNLEISSQKNELVKLQEQIVSYKNNIKIREDLKSILESRNPQIINLSGENGYGKIIYNLDNNTAYLQLAELSGDKSYQLWLETEDGPVKIGREMKLTSNLEFYPISVPSDSLEDFTFRITEVNKPRSIVLRSK